ERTGADEVLARRELAGMALPVAHADVIVDRIAGDMTHRLLPRDAPAGPANDDDELAFPVEHVRFLRLDDRLLVPDLGVGPAREQRGIGGCRPAGLLAVFMVVEADADDLPRIGDDGEIPDPRQLVVRLLALRGLGQGLEGT